MIPFHPLILADKDMIRARVHDTDCRNCDLNFLNLVSWRFLYDTEVAVWEDWLLFRFKADGHLAYLAPVGPGDWAAVVRELLADAEAQGEPFLMLGVCENSLARLNAALPQYFYAKGDRRFSDYIYCRDALSTLAGKKLQPKRNHVNRFLKTYPNYEYLPLTEDLIPACLQLEEKWGEEKAENSGLLGYAAERRSMKTVFQNWTALEAVGGALLVEDRLVAFTFGSPINHDTFGVCVEKADTGYDGAYAVINREFVRRLPPQFVYVNREEDLGIEGLRKAKLSYQPEILLHKYSVMVKHPMGGGVGTVALYQ